MKNPLFFEVGRVVLNGNNWMFNPYTFITRIYYVKSGWAKIYHSSKEHLLEGGNFYFFFQSNDFKIIDSENFDHLYFNITLNFPIANNAFIQMNADDYFLKTTFDLVDYFVKDYGKFNMYETEKPTSVVGHILEGMLDYIDRVYNIPKAEKNFVWRAVEIINADPVGTTVKSLAKELNINEHHFIRSFKKKMVVTPMKYIRARRLSMGLILLKNGEKVEYVADKCGYASSTAFTAALKKIYGVTPKNARTL